jgi:hypothetical protein
MKFEHDENDVRTESVPMPELDPQAKFFRDARIVMWLLVAAWVFGVLMWIGVLI